MKKIRQHGWKLIVVLAILAAAILPAFPIAYASGYIGLSSGSATWGVSADIIECVLFENTAGNGYITELELLSVDTDPSGSVRMGVYSDDGGTPYQRLLDAGTVAVANDGWCTINGLSLSVTSGTYYWLVFVLESQNDIRYATGQPTNSHATAYDYEYAALPSELGGYITYNNNRYVMRAYVDTEGVPTPTPSPTPTASPEPTPTPTPTEPGATPTPTPTGSPGSAPQTTIGTLTLVPTFECIGVYANFTGDTNSNNSAVVQYKKTADEDWKTAMSPIVDRWATVIDEFSHDNPFKYQWRTSLIGLDSNTSYDVRVTFSDADGVSGTNPATANTSTRNETIAIDAANVRYVATNGSNSNDGTAPDSAHAWLTITYGLAHMPAGGTLYIRAGTYHEHALDIQSGTSWSDLTSVVNYQTEVVILDADNLGDNFTIHDKEYFRIKGLKMIDSDSANVRVEDCSHVLLENLTVGDSRGQYQGAITALGCYDYIIRYITLTSTFTQDNEHAGIRCDTSVGLGIIHDVTLDVANNVSPHYDDFIGAHQGDIWTGGFHSDTDIYNCSLNIGATAEFTGGDGIELEGAAVNVRCWDNNFKNNARSTISLQSTYLGPCYVWNNIGWHVNDPNYHCALKMGGQGDGTAENAYCFVYNNTFYDIGYAYATWSGVGWNNKTIKNNIFMTIDHAISFDEEDVDGLVSDYNAYQTGGLAILYSGSSYGTIAAFYAASGYEQHSIQCDPAFINASAGNFYLQGGSGCRDTGIVIQGFNGVGDPYEYDGSAPDIGAFEYDDVSPTPTPSPTPSPTPTPTPCSLPALDTDSPSYIAITSAMLEGTITDTGGCTPTNQGFVWSTSTHGDPGDVAPDSSGYESYYSEEYTGNPFSHSATSLTQGDCYFYRAWAQNSEGYAYGDEVSLITLPYGAYDETITGHTNTVISLSWGKGSGADNTIIRYSSTSYPTSPTSGSAGGNSTGTSIDVEGLTPGTHYYFSLFSWATESCGSVYNTSSYVTLSGFTSPSNVSACGATAEGYNQVNLTWTMGTGSDKTMIRGNDTDYPSTTTDGAQVYFDTGSSYQHSVGGNETWYYSFWAYDSDSGYYSASSCTDNATTGTEGNVTVYFYPDSGTGGVNTSVDGFVYYNHATTWNDVHDGVGAYKNVNDTGTGLRIGITSGATTDVWSALYRTMLAFDTSSLPDDVNIVSANLYVYVTSKVDYGSWTPNINVYGATPAADNALTGNDYLQCGTTAFSTAKSYSTLTVGGWHVYSLNSNGLANLDDTGVSVFSLLNANYDVADSAPAWASSVSSYIYFSSADGQSDRKPKLEVVYSSESEPDPPPTPTPSPPSVVVPAIQVNAASLIDWTAATLNAQILNTGGENLDEVGFDWDTGTGEPYANSWTCGGGGNYTIESFLHRATNLTGSTTYYARAKGHNSAGWGYSSEITFDTLDYSVPTVSTVSATLITQASATVRGTIDDIDGQVADQYVFQIGTETGVYGTTYAFGDAGNYTYDMGSYSYAVTGLACNKKYFYRFGAHNSAGWDYGSEANFTTSVANAPSVTTDPATSITGGGATLRGTITATNCELVDQYIFEWGNSTGVYDGNQTYGTLGVYVYNTGQRTYPLSGYDYETTVYYRFGAHNSGGWAYGYERDFTTSPEPTPTPTPTPAPPSVSTSAASAIDFTAATLNGNVVSVGGASPILVSFQYGATTSYGNTFDVGYLTGAGAFSGNLTMLPEGTTYHYRVRAIGASIAYGSDQTFTTLNTHVGGNQTVEFNGGEITFTTVSVKGLTQITNPPSAACGDLPNDYSRLGNVLRITSTATYEGGITIAVNYAYSGNESALLMYHCTGGSWVNITDSIDENNNIVYGTASSLSDFELGYQYQGISGGNSVAVSLLRALLPLLIAMAMVAAAFATKRWEVIAVAMVLAVVEMVAAYLIMAIL